MKTASVKFKHSIVLLFKDGTKQEVSHYQKVEACGEVAEATVKVVRLLK